MSCHFTYSFAIFIPWLTTLLTLFDMTYNFIINFNNIYLNQWSEFWHLKRCQTSCTQGFATSLILLHKCYGKSETTCEDDRILTWMRGSCVNKIMSDLPVCACGHPQCQTRYSLSRAQMLSSHKIELSKWTRNYRHFV